MAAADQREACHVWWADPRLVPVDARDLLDHPEHTRLAALGTDHARRRFIAGRMLLRRVLSAELGVPPASVRLDATCRWCGAPHGKPRLVAPHLPLALSVAHAGDRVAVAVTRQPAVGVDVERVPAAPADGAVTTDVAATALAPAERRLVTSLPPHAQAAALATYWTRKEAILKADGRGLWVDPAAVTVTPPWEAPTPLAATPATPAPGRVWMSDLAPGPGHAASVAVLNSVGCTLRERWWAGAPTSH